MKYLVPNIIKPYLDEYVRLYINQYNVLNSCISFYINAISNNQLPLLDPLLIDCIDTYIPIDFKIAFLSKNYTTLNNDIYNELLTKYIHNDVKSYGTFYFIDDRTCTLHLAKSFSDENIDVIIKDNNIYKLSLIKCGNSYVSLPNDRMQSHKLINHNGILSNENISIKLKTFHDEIDFIIMFSTK